MGLTQALPTILIEGNSINWQSPLRHVEAFVRGSMYKRVLSSQVRWLRCAHSGDTVDTTEIRRRGEQTCCAASDERHSLNNDSCVVKLPGAGQFGKKGGREWRKGWGAYGGAWGFFLYPRRAEILISRRHPNRLLN